MRETLASEEEVGNTNDSEEYADGIDYLKSYAKYFKGVWTEINKHQSNNFNPNFQTFGIKVSQLLNFINEHSKVIYQLTILYYIFLYFNNMNDVDKR